MVLVFPGDGPEQRLEANRLAEGEPLLSEGDALLVPNKVASDPGRNRPRPEHGVGLLDDGAGGGSYGRGPGSG